MSANYFRQKESNDVNDLAKGIDDYGSIDKTFTDKLPAHLKPIRKDIFVNIQGSLNDFQDRPDIPIWKCDNGSESIYQVHKYWSPLSGEEHSEVPQGNISNALLLGAKILKTYSTFPCEIGVKMSGIEGNVFNGKGENFADILMPREVDNQKDHIVAYSDNYINSDYLQVYPGITADKLDTGIMKDQGTNTTYVDIGHPVVSLIKENEDSLQLQLTDADIIDGTWYKIDAEIVNHCKDKLKNELLKHLPYIDLTEFNVGLQPVNGKTWDSRDHALIQNQSESNQDKILNMTHSVNMVIQLIYCFP